MRQEWVGPSASALIIGVMALVFGFALNPLPQDRPVADSVRSVDELAGTWLASSAALGVASVGLTLGLPALLSLLDRRDRRLGVVAVAVFAVGTVGLCGYALVMIFLRALVLDDLMVVDGIDEVLQEPGVQTFLVAWLGCFMLGIVLLAVGLWRARSVPRWVPVLLAVFVLSQALPGIAGDTGTIVQFLVLAVAFTGAAISANTAAHASDVDTGVSGARR
jgi:hypothetical protein